MSASNGPAARERRWGRVAHVFVALALALPVAAVGAVTVLAFGQPGQTGLNRVLLVLLALCFLGTVAWVALLPPVRQVEVATARSLLGVTLPDVVGPRSWAGRRRGAAWLGMLVAVGLVEAAVLLFALPAGVGLIAQPWSGRAELGVGGLGPFHVGAGWRSAWLAVPGVGCLVVAAWSVLGAGWLLARWAPPLLGPAPAERAELAEQRARELARRNALAREVHDTVGHSLTAMTLQATAARRLLRSDPDRADELLQAVEVVGRRSQADVDEVVGTLRGRRPRADAAVEQVDLLASLAPLLDSCGVDVAVDAPTALPVGRVAQQEAYRVVREALTNAARHGRGTATLRLAVDDATLVVEVRNDTWEPPGVGHPDPGARHGLTGLRERLLLAGGSFTVEQPHGAWVLRARLPR